MIDGINGYFETAWGPQAHWILIVQNTELHLK